MNPDDLYAPPKTLQEPVVTHDRKRLGPLDWVQFFWPSIACIVVTFHPMLFQQGITHADLLGSGFLGITIGAFMCVFAGVRFAQRMKTGGPILSIFLWIIIVTIVNAGLAWAGCMVALNAL